MDVINIHNAKTNLSKLVEQVLAGQEIIISRSGKPVIKLIPYDAPDVLMPRTFGKWKGTFTLSEDCFAPDPDIETLFNNAPLFPKDKP